MSDRRRAAFVAAGVVLVLVGVALLAWRALGDEEPTATAGASARPPAVVTDTAPAGAPFASSTAGTIRVGGRAVDVVVADSLDERVQGLRGRPDAAPYSGMLFVFPTDSTVAFTMAGVPAPLEIAFFDAAGRRVDQLRMEPCQGTDATCPVYESSTPFRYALETAPGEMPSGRLRGATG